MSKYNDDCAIVHFDDEDIHKDDQTMALLYVLSFGWAYSIQKETISFISTEDKQ